MWRVDSAGRFAHAGERISRSRRRSRYRYAGRARGHSGRRHDTRNLHHACRQHAGGNARTRDAGGCRGDPCVRCETRGHRDEEEEARERRWLRRGFVLGQEVNRSESLR